MLYIALCQEAIVTRVVFVKATYYYYAHSNSIAAISIV